MTYYVIEVQLLNEDLLTQEPQCCGKFEVYGLMCMLFNTKTSAAEYINSNVSVAAGTAVSSGVSQVVNGRRYVVRKWRGERLDLLPFNPKHGPNVQTHVVQDRKNEIRATFNKELCPGVGTIVISK